MSLVSELKGCRSFCLELYLSWVAPCELDAFCLLANAAAQGDQTSFLVALWAHLLSHDLFLWLPELYWSRNTYCIVSLGQSDQPKTSRSGSRDEKTIRQAFSAQKLYRVLSACLCGAWADQEAVSVLSNMTRLAGSLCRADQLAINTVRVSQDP